MVNPFEVLGLVRGNISLVELKKKFHDLAKKIRPDKNEDAQAGAEFNLIKMAYEEIKQLIVTGVLEKEEEEKRNNPPSRPPPRKHDNDDDDDDDNMNKENDSSTNDSNMPPIASSGAPKTKEPSRKIGSSRIPENKREGDMFAEEIDGVLYKFIVPAGFHAGRYFEFVLKKPSSVPIPLFEMPVTPILDSFEGEVQQVEEEDTQIWTDYECKSIKFGLPHPGSIVEAYALGFTKLPTPAYPLQASLKQQIDDGSLSQMQLEGIMYACERHSRFLPDGVRRAGFLVGDSAGVGKGRQMAGILVDNIVRGRMRHCWFSASRDLHLDATRDLREIGCLVPVITSLNDLDQNRNVAGAVVFSTYSGLIRKGRLQQLVRWLCFGDASPQARQQFDGVIVFDEAHKAKNLFETDKKESTKTAEVVKELQELLPKARVVYASATGISGIENLGYLTRMGMTGVGTAFKTQGDFVQAIGGGKSVAALELLALEFKSVGAAVSRNVGYRGVEFKLDHVPCTVRQARLYRECVLLWKEALVVLENALLRSGSPKNVPMGQYYGAHQRFFKQLCMSFKVPLLFELAQAALSDGYAIVIGLQSTGEAALRRDDSLDEEEALYAGVMNDYNTSQEELLSVCRSVFDTFVSRHIPSKRFLPLQEGEPRENLPKLEKNVLLREISLVCCHMHSKKKDVGRLQHVSRFVRLIFHFAYETPGQDEFGHVQPIGFFYDKNLNLLETLDEIAELKRKSAALELPPCALDDLIDRLGGKDRVAEMTGRHIRQVRDLSNNRFVIEKRLKMKQKPTSREGYSSDDSNHNAYAGDVSRESDSINVQERTNFMRGSKLVAIISEAASTGVSLHADKNVQNRRRRMHFTLELPWAADQAIQQLGRSHRTNQVEGPVFRLLSTCVAGEHRFVSSIAKRLESLGALTQGDRRASMGAMSLGLGNLETFNGKEAVKILFKTVCRKALPSSHAGSGGVDYRQVLRDSREMLELDLAAEPLVDGRFSQRKIFRAVDGTDNNNMPLQSDFPAIDYSTIKDDEMFYSLLVEPLAFISGGLCKVSAHKTNGYLNLLEPLEFGAISSITRFLNRLLGLPLGYQSLIFNLFLAIMDADIKKDKMLGKYEANLSKIDGREVALNESLLAAKQVLFTDLTTGGKLIATHIRVDRGMTFDDCLRELLFQSENMKGNAKGKKRNDFPVPNVRSKLDFDSFMATLPTHMRFYKTKHKVMGRSRYLVAYVRNEKEAGNDKELRRYVIMRPETGFKYKDEMTEEALTKSFEEMKNFDLIKSSWNASFHACLCYHGPNCKNGEFCTTQMRFLQTTILNGSVVRHLPVLQKFLTKGEKKQPLKICQTQLAGSGEFLVGVEFPTQLVEELHEELRKLQQAEVARYNTKVVASILIPSVAIGGDDVVKDPKSLRAFLERPLSPAMQLKLFGFCFGGKSLKVTQVDLAFEQQRGVSVGDELCEINDEPVSSDDVNDLLCGLRLFQSDTPNQQDNFYTEVLRFKRSGAKPPQSAKLVVDEMCTSFGLVSEVPTPVNANLLRQYVRPVKQRNRKRKSKVVFESDSGGGGGDDED